MEICDGCAKTRLANLNEGKLNGFVGKKMEQICDLNFIDTTQNHCAHFVSHVLNLKIGLICGNLRYATKGKGVTVRVNELFNRCKFRGSWEDRPRDGEPVMVFSTIEANIRDLQMGQHPKKHVGVSIGDHVWHFSNSKGVVVRDSVAAFKIKFDGAYGPTNSLFWGAFDEHVQ